MNEQVEYRVTRIESDPDRSAEIESRNRNCAERSFSAWMKKVAAAGYSCLATLRMRLALAERS
jgi:hypothetical protein